MGPRDQSGSVEQFDRGRSDLLGLVKLREEVETRIRQGRDAHLSGMDLSGIRRRPGQQLKECALATSRETDQSDSHSPAFLSKTLTNVPSTVGGSKNKEQGRGTIRFSMGMPDKGPWFTRPWSEDSLPGRPD